MDTKLKSYSHSNIAKLIAFILVVASFTSMVIVSLKTIGESKVDLFDSPFEKNYYLSTDYGWEITNAIRDLGNLIRYKNEEYIKSGKTIDIQEFENEKEFLFNEFLRSEKYQGNLTREENYKRFEELEKEKIKSLKEKIIKEDLLDFKKILSKLEQNEGLIYYGKQGNTVFTNTEKNTIDDFERYPAYVISQGNGFEFYPEESEKSRNYSWVYGDINTKLEIADEIRIAFTDDYINEKLIEWGKSRQIIEYTMYILLSIFIVLILSLLYLLLVTGKNSFKNKEIVISKIDKLLTDINIIFIISIIAIWVLIMQGFTSYRLNLANIIGIGIVSALSCALVLALLLSLIRHIKNKSLFSHSLVFIMGKKLYTLAKDIYDSGNVAVKVAIAVIIYPALVAMTAFMFPITIGFVVWLTHRKVKEYMAIKEGVAKIKEGAIDHKIEINRYGEFKTLAEDINSIGEGFQSAIANELKSEKLKTELITNVSHDIRTPLTSIITYVDLIKNEKDEIKLKEYIEIIETKSMRLKNLTDDLFEASKASSGNIPVNYEKIDVVSLITQGLGELDTQVRKSQLEFKINNQIDKIYVNADGRLLWRSIENLLTNIFKYALKKSRVYIDILDLEDKVELSIKNISAYELNISSDELMERFKRGDKSRTSEGSGLGLSISKSLIEAQGGNFDIIIDGDLFKVVIIISKYS